ncbi:MAG: phosphotransferase [Lachnospiraceae bacterium]|nr:phosphotransferase [Lachnospiraceae bacterium]
MKETSIEHEVNLVNNADLEKEIGKRLVEYNLIPTSDNVKLHPTHRVMIRGEWFSHFIVTCTHSRKSFFLKTVKENDNFLLCNRFLQNLSMEDAEYIYPKIVVPVFAFQGMNYYITTYIEGQALDTFPETLPQSTVNHIADRLLELIDQLTCLKASQYSERGAFVSDDCANILKKKLKARSLHPLITSYPRKKIDRAINWSSEILDYSQFSQPTLIHMDIKPANIIYNSETGLVSLIDFEFARFGDIDYGWTQVLLSGCNQFNQFYTEQIVPRLTNNRVTLDDALSIPKYQCYLFYQTMCNLIYYYDCHLPCPKEMVEIFEHFIAKM